MGAHKRKIDIRESARALLTDTLPYEIPIFFSNANLAVLAYRTKKQKAILPLHQAFLLRSTPKQNPTVPYAFDIARGAQSPRRLSVMHPRSQYLISEFYGTHDQFICNACSRSSISLRYPSRVATHYIDPRYAQNNLPPEGGNVDEDPVGFRNQKRWASTYFSYRDYSLSHKFFESQEFVELERRYRFLLKLDVARCFDSIYTHSIEWSMRGKVFSKEHLPRSDRSTFESKFDEVIRHGNWSETHGILIGPESSRIFAEVILQSSDVAILDRLPFGAFTGVIRRYVDDYYLFSNSEEELVRAEDVVRKSLQALNLHLNGEKREVLKRPFVSRISVIRNDAADIIDEFFRQTSTRGSSIPCDIDPQEIERIRISTVSKMRRRSVELQATYDQFSSFALSVLKNKLHELISLCGNQLNGFPANSLVLLSWLIAIARIAQFLFSMDRRATTSYKLASVYSCVTQLASMLGCARAPIERQILDGLRDPTMGCLDPSVDEITRINHICSVDLLLTGDRRLEIGDVHNYLGDTTDAGVLSSMSPFVLMAHMFLGRRRARFSGLRRSVVCELVRRLSLGSCSPQVDASHALLLTEYLACPHILLSDRTEMYRSFHKRLLGNAISSVQAEKMLTKASWVSFVDWDRSVDLAAMLERKELTPAYE
jgi:hypothetical protein